MVLKLYACRCTHAWSNNKNSILPAVTLPIGLRVSGHVTSWGLVREHQTLDLRSNEDFVFAVHWLFAASPIWFISMRLSSNPWYRV